MFSKARSTPVNVSVSLSSTIVFQYIPLHKLKVHVSNTILLVAIARLLIFGRCVGGRRCSSSLEYAWSIKAGLVQDLHAITRCVGGDASPAAREAVAESSIDKVKNRAGGSGFLWIFTLRPAHWSSPRLGER